MNEAIIDYTVIMREDRSYAYAVAKPRNTLSVRQLTNKAIKESGINIAPAIAEGILSSYMTVAKEEVAEGNRVYFPANDGNGVAFYPIIDNSTLKAGDKDSDGELIDVTVENLVARAGGWKTRLGAQVSNDFAVITKPSHLHYSGKCKVIANTTITPGSSNNDNQGGGNNNGGSEEIG